MQTRLPPPPDSSDGDRTTLPWRRSDTGIVVRFRLTPRSSRTAIDGIGVTAEGPAVLARVNAVPEDNAANAALTGLVAAWLERPKRDIALVGGAKSRIKSVAVAGDPDALGRLLAEKMAAIRPGADRPSRAGAPGDEDGGTADNTSKT